MFGIVREPSFEDGVLGVPHGFDLGGIGAAEAVEGREGDPLVGAEGGDHFGVWFGVEGIEAALGLLIGTQRTIPINILRFLLPLRRRHALHRRQRHSPPCQHFRQVRRPELVEDLLFRAVGEQLGFFFAFGGEEGGALFGVEFLIVGGASSEGEGGGEGNGG